MSEKPEYLERIYEMLEKEVSKMVAIIGKICWEGGQGQSLQGPTYKAFRAVLVIDCDGTIRICDRAHKTDSEIELLLLRKKELREGGLSSAYWDVVVTKAARALETRGLIGKRNVYSTKKQMMG